MSRPYRSLRREEQAQETRRLIVDAARRVFAERGFTGASIAAIAEAAGVSVPTVYASVGAKSALLAAFQERIDADSAVPASIAAIRAGADPLQVVREAVGLTRRINEQFGDIIRVFRAAATSEPEAAAAVAEGLRRHRSGFDLVARRLDELGALRPGLTVRAAAEALGVLTLWGTWDAMVLDYGWSWDAAAEWLVEVARATVLAPGPTPRQR